MGDDGDVQELSVDFFLVGDNVVVVNFTPPSPPPTP